MRKGRTMKNHKKETFWAYLCSAPSLLLILLIVVFPILYTAYISFTNMNVYHWFNFSFVGLKNYKDALFVFDSGFFSSITSYYTVDCTKHGTAVGDCFCAGKSAEYTEL